MAVNNSPQRIRCIEVSSPGQPAVKLLEPNHFSSNYTLGTGTHNWFCLLLRGGKAIAKYLADCIQTLTRGRRLSWAGAEVICRRESALPMEEPRGPHSVSSANGARQDGLVQAMRLVAHPTALPNPLPLLPRTAPDTAHSKPPTGCFGAASPQSGDGIGRSCHRNSR
jgi:hypothetical protein